MRRHLTLALALTTALVLAVLAAHSCSPNNQHPTDPPTAIVTQKGHTTRPVGPTRKTRGVPGGWRHDETGARAAAISAVNLNGPIAKAGFITRSDMIHQLTSDRYGPTLARTSANQLDQLMADIGTKSIVPAQLIWDDIPLTATITRSNRATAQVRVWSVAVLGAPDVGVPNQTWHTVTVDLVWQHNDWKVNGWVDRPGPTPTLADGTDTGLFDQIRRVTGWPRAVGGQ